MSLAESLESLKNFDINDLDVNNAGIWPAPIKAIVLLIVFGLVFGGGYWFFVKDMYSSLSRYQHKEGQLKHAYETKAYKVANLKIYKQQMKEMQQTFGALVKQLPSDTEVPGLLEDITNTAVGNGLKLLNVTLKPEKSKDFYIELPIDIKVVGGYHEFGSFVSGVAGLPRIVTLHDFTIKHVTGQNSSDKLEMHIEARTYRYKKAGG